MGSRLLSGLSFSASEVGGRRGKASENPKIGVGTSNDKSNSRVETGLEEGKDTEIVCTPLSPSCNDNVGWMGKGAHIHVSFIHSTSIY